MEGGREGGVGLSWNVVYDYDYVGPNDVTSLNTRKTIERVKYMMKYNF